MFCAGRASRSRASCAALRSAAASAPAVECRRRSISRSSPAVRHVRLCGLSPASGGTLPPPEGVGALSCCVASSWGLGLPGGGESSTTSSSTTSSSESSE